jgi:cell division protein FtsB
MVSFDEQKALQVLAVVGNWFHRMRRRLATIAVCLLAAWVAFHVIFGANGMVAYHKKRAEHRLLQKELEDLQKENEQLQQRIKGLRTDPKVVEKEAREQLRYARPGETVYVMPNPKSAGHPASADKR